MSKRKQRPLQGKKPPSSSLASFLGETKKSGEKLGDSAKRRKRESLGELKNDDEPNVCWFCRQAPPALTLELPTTRGGKVERKYCLKCYYTSRVVRMPAEAVTTSDQEQLDEQLPEMQNLFSTCMLDLQKQISQESERAFRKQRSDPLSVLHMTGKKKRKAPPVPSNKKKYAESGGFLRSVPIPERLKKLQQAQTQPPAPSVQFGNVYQRRKSSKRSIWNLAMDPNATSVSSSGPKNEQDNHGIKCSCGSTDVSQFGNVTSRNQDMAKGETWGMKDRMDEVMVRYQCRSCGKLWNESG